MSVSSILLVSHSVLVIIMSEPKILRLVKKDVEITNYPEVKLR